jgi:SAM-dependent methyltransferase
MWSGLVSGIYDRLIVGMTMNWYKTVLEKLPDDALVLDVGIGTASALLLCKDMVLNKRLRIVGIDYNSFYIEAAKKAVEDAGMSHVITVLCMDIYDQDKVQTLIHQDPGSESKLFDAVYFSGSFSLLPKPLEALLSLSPILSTNHGRIYITQTYQRRTPFLLHRVKPLLKYLTTIDFGNLVTTEDIMQLYNKSGLEIVEHEVIAGSVDNYWQAAYLSVLKLPPSSIKE